MWAKVELPVVGLGKSWNHWLSGLTLTARTSAPWDKKSATRWPPMNPRAPAITIFSLGIKPPTNYRGLGVGSEGGGRSSHRGTGWKR